MRKNLLITTLVFIGCCFFIFTVPASAASHSGINILLNGKAVEFTNDSGYPFVDENNRTMVPLRVTMESAGFVVGYDTNARTAIVITEHNRIEVPIGTNKIYTNNQLTENDTVAVVKNGRTYLPIRAVLENAGYTVEWAGDTNTVNAYTFNYDAKEFVPYSTSSLSTLLENILKGNVIYYQGQYYATPEYVKMMTNVQVHYYGNDLNTAIYPQASRYDLAEFDESQIEWVSGITFDYILVQDSQLAEFGIAGKRSDIPGYSYVYAFYEQGISGDKIIYCVDEMTDKFINATDATGTFNGIRMKKESGTLFFNYADLKAKGIYSR
ncbi:copper amine oxidase N-terminal domain-containing protein [Desulforamulus ruminis]|uniref:Copper amine oxidase-like domain-containing protein n=1 Tax=Desulforamulus ruminis (strain ATCC 23193 / DSM 2154 / NCIMB 8452 / DL) TaxID=696281 RepID=F6DMJ4_DESRL|nr:copper amine oxidase N-terminal domain-containing protein [Desulforamulus ruminis]AEG61755.1 copper amine oxidase-like domain-containing protein [Desulforamulus ruminis DSM 2154]